MTLARIDTDEGVSSFGGTCPFGANYLRPYCNGISTSFGLLAPGLVGRDPTRIGAIDREMNSAMRGKLYIKSAVEVACWDIFGKSLGLSVQPLPGGRQLDDISMYRPVSPSGPGKARCAGIFGVLEFSVEGCDRFTPIK